VDVAKQFKDDKIFLDRVDELRNVENSVRLLREQLDPQEDQLRRLVSSLKAYIADY